MEFRAKNDKNISLEAKNTKSVHQKVFRWVNLSISHIFKDNCDSKSMFFVENASRIEIKNYQNSRSLSNTSKNGRFGVKKLLGKH